MAGIAKVVKLVVPRKAFQAESVGIDLEASRGNQASSRVQEGEGISNNCAIGAAELRAIGFRTAGGAGAVDSARLRALDAVAVVHGVAIDAGVAAPHTGALAIGTADLAVLQVEEVGGGAAVYGCGLGVGHSQHNGHQEQRLGRGHWGFVIFYMK